MMIDYGFAKIEINGKSFSIEPTFRNLCKFNRGDIEKEIEYLKSRYDVCTSFIAALNILDKFTAPSIKDFLIPKVKIKNGKLLLSSERELRFCRDIIALANHCILHGFVGKTDFIPNHQAKNSDDTFNVYEFINSAQDKRALGRSREESLNMSMTEYIDAMRTAFPDAFKGMTVDEDREAQEFYKEHLRMMKEKGLS